MLSTSIDDAYAKLGHLLIHGSEYRKGRNGNTYSIFGTQLQHDMANGFPILSIRKIFWKGVLGEFISFLQDAKSVQEFEANGCNYWKLWAEDDGSLKLDYPPRKQLDYVIDLIKNDPESRRIIIDLWNPENRGKLSLDPCHTQYQFSVRNGNRLDMIWNQRSVDYAIGAPSDFILAGLYVTTIANECGLTPGIITFNFGDTHLYEEHYEDFKTMIETYYYNKTPKNVQYKLEATTKTINKDSLELIDYDPVQNIKFLLKA